MPKTTQYKIAAQSFPRRGQITHGKTPKWRARSEPRVQDGREEELDWEVNLGDHACKSTQAEEATSKVRYGRLVFHEQIRGYFGLV